MKENTLLTQKDRLFYQQYTLKENRKVILNYFLFSEYLMLQRRKEDLDYTFLEDYKNVAFFNVFHINKQRVFY